jgi:hypothetical protein
MGSAGTCAITHLILIGNVTAADWLASVTGHPLLFPRWARFPGELSFQACCSRQRTLAWDPVENHLACWDPDTLEGPSTGQTSIPRGKALLQLGGSGRLPF